MFEINISNPKNIERRQGFLKPITQAWASEQHTPSILEMHLFHLLKWKVTIFYTL
jgi:hypothetical protein